MTQRLHTLGPLGTRRPLIALLSFVTLLALFSDTKAARTERLVDSWQPKHYDLNIALSDGLTEITSARAEIEVVALKTLSVIDLDFGELTTDRVTLNSKPVSFEHKDGKLLIKLTQAVNPGTTVNVVVTYHGKPKDGLILMADKDGKPSAIGDNWPNRVHHWIPTLDHPSAKASVTFNISAPGNNIVVANGSLDHVATNANGSRVWTFTEESPIPPYCMIIGVGQFTRLESTQAALTQLSYYVPQSDSGFALKGFSPAAPVLQFLSQTVGPYPYEKLALIVGNTRFGGMENSGAIVFTSSLFNPNPAVKLSEKYGIPDGTVSVVAHEIAHQWFGDSVTESTWSDLWLSEGFATYFAGLFIQRYEGEAAFQTYMKQAAEATFAYEKQTRTPIFDRDTEDLSKLLNPNNYQKGSWVLHILRSRLGDAAFFRGIQDYYQAHKNSNANTDDLRAALEKTSGKNLKAFFERWIYESGHPQYELSTSWDARRGNATLTLKQLQPGKPFLDPVPIKIVSGPNVVNVTITPNGPTSTRVQKLKAKPSSIEIDPNNTLLKEATVSLQ
jgi:aminopeptidase N